VSIEIILTNDEVAQAERIGRARQGLHEEFGNDWNAENRFYDDSAKTNIIGMYGEVGFARLFDLPVDESLRPDGDNGVDFTMYLDFGTGIRETVVDVKTAKYPKYLLVREHEIDYPIDVFVLCKYARFDRRLEYLGWTFEETMRQQPIKDYGGYGIMSYGMLASELYDMSKFEEAVKRAREKIAERVKQTAPNINHNVNIERHRDNYRF